MTRSSAYEQVTRQMVNDLKGDVTEIKDKVNCFDRKLNEVTNHMSSRLPWWGTIVVGALLSLVTGLIISR